ncbi:hypothetical protein Agub_g11497, partial [Astrephomene gubernaculifera]
MLPYEIARQLQAVCAVARSFLGPNKALKCIIDSCSDARNGLVGTIQAFLLAAEGDPTATTLLLETLECQAPATQDAPCYGCAPGSGATWLATFCGLLLGRVLQLLDEQGLPYECVRAGVLQAVGECCEAVGACALELPMVAEQRWQQRPQELSCYCDSVMSLVIEEQQQQHGGPDEQHGDGDEEDEGGECEGARAVAAMLSQPEDLLARSLGRDRGEAPEQPVQLQDSLQGCRQQQQMQQHDSSCGQSRGRGAVVKEQADDEFGWFDELMTTGGVAAAAWETAVVAARTLAAGAEAATAGAEATAVRSLGGVGHCTTSAGTTASDTITSGTTAAGGTGLRRPPPLTGSLRSCSHRTAARGGDAGGVADSGVADDDDEDDEFGWFESYVVGDAVVASVGGAAGAVKQQAAAREEDAGRNVHGSLTAFSSSGDVDSDDDDRSTARCGSSSSQKEEDFGSHEHDITHSCAAAARGCNAVAAAGTNNLGTALSVRTAAEPQTPCNAECNTGNGRCSGDGSSGGDGGEADEEVLAALEEEAAWFFGEGELQAEREVRAQRRELGRLGARLGALLGPKICEAAVAKTTARAAVVPLPPTGSTGTIMTSLPPQPQPRQQQENDSADVTAALAEVPASEVNRQHAASRCGGVPSRLDPLSRLVCAAAAGLAHGRELEMRLAAAAALLLLGPMVRRPPPSSLSSSTCSPSPTVAAEVAAAAAIEVEEKEDEESLAAVAERVGQAAARLRYDRCILTSELMGRPAEVSAGVLCGVCVPLSSLSDAQANLATSFFTASKTKSAGNHAPPSSCSNQAITAVFFHGALQPDHVTHGSLVITDAAGLAAADADARLESYASRLLAKLRPHGVQLLLASGHIPDRLVSVLHQLTDGALLALGGVGVRAVQAAAACCGVATAASLSFLGPYCLATGTRVDLAAGGLGLRDYRRGGGGGGGGGGESGGGKGHVAQEAVLRVMAPDPSGQAPTKRQVQQQQERCQGPLKPPVQPGGSLGPRGGPGWVTVVLAHTVPAQLELQAAAFKTSFQRLIAALRSCRVLPGAGAWELAVAEHLSQRADKLQQQQQQREEREEPHAASKGAVAADTPTATATRAATSSQAAVAALAAPRVTVKAAATPAAMAGGVQVAVAADDIKEEESEGDPRVMYTPLCYRAVAEALREMVGVVLQNAGCGWLESLAAVAVCTRHLREGNVEALKRLAGTEAAAAVATAAGVSGGAGVVSRGKCRRG